MSEGDLIRKLSSKEKRRLQTSGMLPVDAVDPSCSIRHLIEQHDVKFLYRRSWGLIEMNPQLKDSGDAVRRNVFLYLRGSNSINFISLLFHSSIFCVSLRLSHPSDRIRFRRRRSSSPDEQSFIFEPLLVVCVLFCRSTNDDDVDAFCVLLLPPLHPSDEIDFI